jgi:hypothetical protein
VSVVALQFQTSPAISFFVWRRGRGWLVISRVAIVVVLGPLFVTTFALVLQTFALVLRVAVAVAVSNVISKRNQACLILVQRLQRFFRIQRVQLPGHVLHPYRQCRDRVPCRVALR